MLGTGGVESSSKHTPLTIDRQSSIASRRRSEYGSLTPVVLTTRAAQVAGPRFGTSIVRVARPRAKLWLATRRPLQFTSTRARTPALLALPILAVKVTRRPGPSRPNGIACARRGASVPLRVITRGGAAGVAGGATGGVPPSSARSACFKGSSGGLSHGIE